MSFVLDFAINFVVLIIGWSIFVVYIFRNLLCSLVIFASCLQLFLMCPAPWGPVMDVRRFINVVYYYCYYYYY